MNIALIGNGKTGRHLQELIPSDQLEIFNLENPPTVNKLKNFDIAIIFIPADQFTLLMPTLLESKIPVVSGATGAPLPKTLGQDLKDKKLTWIYASNFSIGISMVHQMINILNNGQILFDKINFSLTDIHHTKKLDKPSGTAIEMGKRLNKEIKITSIREGDTVGIHELNMDTPLESISIKHIAHNRALFAKGALWAAEQLLNNKNLMKHL